MENRVYRFLAGVEQDAAPDQGTPVDPADLITLSYLQTFVAAIKKITNTFASPYSAVAGTSIAHGMTSANLECEMYLKGSSGAVDMSANPQIAAGTKDGQRLTLVFTSDTDTVFLEDGTGIVMPNGNVRSALGTILQFDWDDGQSKWRNTFWNNVGGIV